jgi:eukaryotic translation initiation factor 2C
MVGVRRKKLSTYGKEAVIALNVFKAAVNPNLAGFNKFDVKLSPDTTLRNVKEKIWNSNAVRERLGPGWIYDGNKLAWHPSNENRQTVSIQVDLGFEEGRGPSKPDSKNVFMLSLRHSGKTSFGVLNKALRSSDPLHPDEQVQLAEAIGALDHVLHQHPRAKNILFRKSFYPKYDKELYDDKNRQYLGGGVHAVKGTFAAFRLVYQGPGPNPASLAVNVDVSNGCFWQSGSFIGVVLSVCNFNTAAEITATWQRSSKQGTNAELWANSPMYKSLKKLRRLKVVYLHQRKVGVKDRQYTVERVIPKGPSEFYFVNEKVKPPVRLSVKEYLMKTYGVPPPGNLPLVEMTNGNVVPMECLEVVADQRYPFKLDEKQTSNMIKFAVTVPSQRWQGIEEGLRMLQWNNDPWLKLYNIRIESNRHVVKGRILNTPDIQFQNGKSPATTNVSGRWRIDGKKFLRNNGEARNPLKNWGICVLDSTRGGPSCVSNEVAEKFAKAFVRVYQSHGGVFLDSKAHITTASVSTGGAFIETAYVNIGKAKNGEPQLIFFIVADKNADTYFRIKKSCDCRYGVASQVVQAAHVIKCQDQYISNVCMKVNAKLGGATSRAIGSTPMTRDCIFHKGGRVMILGADVSHAPPGTNAGSVASLTMSCDQTFSRYMAQVETNGIRVELIATEVIGKMFKQMLQVWMANHNGQFPERILYLRDGVSNEQCAGVIAQEMQDLRYALNAMAGRDIGCSMTVAVCTKRHHIRFFPQKGDRNGNPIPGTLVETGCTDPWEFDWYLCAHVAIKGTARPVHYMCIFDDSGVSHEHLQQFIFEHSFQYARSTTPVSLHPAIYYAHLASNRGKCHENAPATTSGKKGIAEKIHHGMDPKKAVIEQKKEAEAKKLERLLVEGSPSLEIVPLMPIKPSMSRLAQHMWYI